VGVCYKLGKAHPNYARSIARAGLSNVKKGKTSVTLILLPVMGSSTAFQPAGVAPSTMSKRAASAASPPAVASNGTVTRWRRSAGRRR